MIQESNGEFTTRELGPFQAAIELIQNLTLIKTRLWILAVVQFCFAIILILFTDENSPLLKYAVVASGVSSVVGPSIIIRLGRRRLRGLTQDADIGSGKSPPPAIAEWIVVLIKVPAMRDAFIGDLEEEFFRDSARFGSNRARRFYWARTIRSIAPLLWQAIKRFSIAAFALAGFKKWIGL